MPEVRFYNTLTGEKEFFLPQVHGRVKMYACGVTVYDHCHIGHGRSLFVFSLLKRFLKRVGYQVTFVRNITDVDDKIIARIWEQNSYKEISQEELKDFVDRYISSYYQDLEDLGLPKADYEPRATEFINEMIGFVEKLIDKGFAYVTEKGNVYYSVDRFSDYGKLSKRKIDELLQGVRKGIEEDKRNPLDFALWKARKENEPYWESPWGEGRPGWHLECAVMSTTLLGGPLDVHGGGRDLIFPHHENEIAEAEPILGQDFAKYWIHHGMVTVEGEKMSKSLGNFITIKDALSRYPARLWRLWYLSGHYRSPIDFSSNKMDEIRKMQEKIDRWYAFLVKGGKASRDLDGLAEHLREGVYHALADDLNTPKALGVLFSVINKSVEFLKDGKGSSKLRTVADDVCSLLFIEPKLPRGQSGLDDELVDLIVQARSVLRSHREFKLADKIRGELNRRGIIIEDTKEGSRWMYR